MRYSDEQVARICYAACGQLSVEQGAPRLPAWNSLCPVEQSWWVQGVTRYRMGMLPERVQEEWRSELAGAGWRFGLIKDHSEKIHPGLVCWSALGPEGRRWFQVMQIMTFAMTMDSPADYEDLECVTALLSDIPR